MQLKHDEQLVHGQAPLNENQNNRQQQVTAEKHISEQDNYQYYEQYTRLYRTAHCLSIQLKQLNQNKDDIWLKVSRLQKKTEDFKDDIRGEPPQRKKRFRRTAQQIQKKCQRNYGSEGSLQQHIKLKHPQLYQSKSHYQNSAQESQYS